MFLYTTRKTDAFHTDSSITKYKVEGVSNNSKLQLELYACKTALTYLVNGKQMQCSIL